MDLITIRQPLQKIHPVVKPQAFKPVLAKWQQSIRLALASGMSDFAQCIN
ncbi:hypothetical protein PSHI8_15390 [Polynucleobacter sp. SHI8]|nr:MULTISPECIES: hypothetical protein [unclassified Polynucleobacter]BDW11456.1 hypothetical protein PSHI2_15380 [Polynucleobacter sp. SHI2]BDW13903.1 hypothetical protein PSHI8_15390 [Polynucleobacter sp. SHI8]